MPRNQEKEKEKDYTKWIGYILFVITLIGWGFTAGQFFSKMDNLENELKTTNVKLEKQQELLLDQQKFNGSVLTYIEMTEKKRK